MVVIKLVYFQTEFFCDFVALQALLDKVLYVKGLANDNLLFLSAVVHGEDGQILARLFEILFGQHYESREEMTHFVEIPLVGIFREE